MHSLLILAIQRNSKCHCVTRIEGAVSSEKCNVNCPDGKSCGGKYDYSVYEGTSRERNRTDS